MKKLKNITLKDVAIVLVVTAWAVGMVVVISMSIMGKFN